MSTFVDEGKPWDVRNMPKTQKAAKGNDNHRSLSKDGDTSPVLQGRFMRLFKKVHALINPEVITSTSGRLESGGQQGLGCSHPPTTPPPLQAWQGEMHLEGSYYLSNPVGGRKVSSSHPAPPFPLSKSSLLLCSAYSSSLACLPGFAIPWCSQINPFSLVRWLAILFLRLTTLFSRKGAEAERG